MTHHLPSPPEFGTPLPIASAPEVLRFLARRRSASALTLSPPGPSESELADLLRLAVRVPDHGKLSPWRFVVFAGDDKDRFVQRLDALARARGDGAAAAKLGKLRAPPVAIAVISAPKPGAIPEWEQVLSAGAVCANLLIAATAMGFGANWITDWYSYDTETRSVLGLTLVERVAGFLLVGTSRDPPLERERPDTASLAHRWRA